MMPTEPAWFTQFREQRALEQRRLNVKESSAKARFKRAGAAPKFRNDAVGTVRVAINLQSPGRVNAKVKGNLEHRLLIAEAKVSAVMAAIEEALFE
jgi:uncharacterized membrane protein